nr:hypothetical protein [Tanacetum cinerariifolium]
MSKYVRVNVSLGNRTLWCVRGLLFIGRSSSNLAHKPFVPSGFAFAGAGAILKRLCNSKTVGKGRSRSESSPVKESYGKRSNFCKAPLDEVLSKVLDRIAYDKSINKQMVFKEGTSDCVKGSSKIIKNDGYCLIGNNDGSFINNPIEPLAFDVGSNNSSLKNKGVLWMDLVESTRKANEDGMEGVNVSSAFVFGDLQRNKGILNRPPIGLSKVQFGPSLFYKSKSVYSSSNSDINVLKSDGSINIESFAKKMKKGVEDKELQIKFVPEFVSKRVMGLREFIFMWMILRRVNKEGMKAVLKSGPWMINNVPLVLNVWELVIWLEKIKPSTIPIWVCVYGIMLELCNGNGIGKIMSGIGKPMLMDKLTRERCLKKLGKLDFARVLVEVSAGKDLPRFLKIDYPVITDRPARIESEGNDNVDGFTVVGKKNKPVVNQSNVKQNTSQSKSFNNSFQNKGFQKEYKFNGKFNSGGRGPNFQDKGENGGGSKQYGNVISWTVQKPPLNSKYNANFHPKVLVRGSSSNKFVDSLGENVPVANSFQVLEDHNMIDKEENFYFFYNSRPKYGMEPYVEDDDVESENEGITAEMVLENVVDDAPDVENGGTNEDYAVNGSQKFFCSFVYAQYEEVGRRTLWNDLVKHNIAIKGAPWSLLGDFNVIIDPSERSFGCSSVADGMDEFRNCISQIEVNDLVMSGIQFTWNKTPKSVNGLLKKLDRVMCNMEFLDKFLNSNAIFLPFICSDHAPSVLNISCIEKDVPGYSMFSLALKLKLLKKPFGKLKYSQGDLAENVRKLKDKLSNVQEEMVKDPFNVELRIEEIGLLNDFTSAVKDRELFLKQKAKVSWLSEGDFNTKYFNNAMKERRNKSRIDFMEDFEGNGFSRSGVWEQFISYFEQILGRSEVVDSIHDPSHLFTNKLSVEVVEFMVKPISKDEIKVALFSMEDDKASGPDGFSFKFFKSAWSIVGHEFSQAILDFFANGKFLKEINATVIALVPKSQTPRRVFDFRRHIVMRIRDGRNTSVWFDNWSFIGPLCQFISKRDIFEADLPLSCKINDVVSDGESKWHDVWRSKFLFLFHLPPPLILSGRKDVVLWKSRYDKLCLFSVKAIWTVLSIPKPIVPWVALWNKVNDLKCPLCNSVKDDHNNLFFGCEYSSKVWNYFKGLMRLRLLSSKIKWFKQSMEAAKLWKFHVVQGFACAWNRKFNYISKWVVSELIKHHEVFAKVTEKLDRVIGQDIWVEEKDMPNLPYIKAILKESLRLHPVTPLLVIKRTCEDCRVAGYAISEET